MRNTLRITIVSTAVAAVWIGGCGGDGTTPPSATRQNDPALLTQNTGQTTPAQNTAPAQQAAPGNASATPVVDAPVPIDARFTILCGDYVGPANIQESRLAKDNLIRATGRTDFHVLHNGQGSQLYLGYYRARDAQADAAEAKRVQADIAWLKTLKTPMGQRLFSSTAVVPMPVADPEAPPEFDLTRIDMDKAPDDPTRAYWTVAIGAFTADASENRKKAAVDAVMEARTKYKVEAYYYHGDNVSTVCVGAWPRTAVREQETEQVRSRVEGQELVVAAAPLPDRLTKQLEDQGRNMKVYQPRIDVTDPRLLETWKQFPTYAVNGQEQVNTITDPNTQQRVQRTQPSFLVEIPRVQPTLLRGGAPAQDAPPPSLLSPRPAGGTEGGRLRSVDR